MLVFGDCAYDLFCEVNFLPKPNQAAEVVSTQRFYGGMGANCAVQAANLGLSSALVSVVGGDAGDYKKHLSELGVDTYWKSVFGDTPKSVFYKTGSEQISFFDRGVSKHLDELDVDTELPRLPKKPRATFLARCWLNLYKHIVKKYVDAKVFWNPGYGVFQYTELPKEFHAIIKSVDALILNQHEFKHLRDLGYTVDFKGKLRYIVVTEGEVGSKILTKNTQTHVSSYKTEVVDESGAGDAFNAGFIWASLSGREPIEAAALGNATASYAVEKWGCQTNLAKKDRILKRYEKIR